jgi:hypothetical protein
VAPEISVFTAEESLIVSSIFKQVCDVVYFIVLCEIFNFILIGIISNLFMHFSILCMAVCNNDEHIMKVHV